MPATAREPTASASVSLPRSSPAMVRAARRIQKIIQVTKTTAATEVTASNSSRDSEVRSSEVEVYWIREPKTTESATARPTPAHTCGSRSRRCDLTRKATRMLTTSVASRPSRRPIRYVANMGTP